MSYCTRKRPCFHVFIFFLQFQIVSDTARMNTLETLFFCFFSTVPNRFRYRKNACFKYIIVFNYLSAVPNRFRYRKNACFRYIIVFNYFPTVPNRFKYRKNACFRYIIVFNYFSAVPNRFRYHQNEYFRDIVFIFFLQFQIVLDTTRMHALETMYMWKR